MSNTEDIQLLTIDEAKNAVLDGVHAANKKYIKWSNGLDVFDSGVESLISANIAESIFSTIRDKDDEGSISLETPFSMIWDFCKGKVSGRKPSIIRDTLRADVVYWDKNEIPRGVVEVKRRFEYSRLEDDITRSCKLIEKLGKNNDGLLKWAAVAGALPFKSNSMKEPNIILSDFLEKCGEKFDGYKFSGRTKRFELDSPVELQDETQLFSYDAYVVLFRRKRE